MNFDYVLFLHENGNFLFKILKKRKTEKYINYNICFQNNFRSYNAPNCPIKNILLGGGGIPQTPHTAHLARSWASSRFATYKFSSIKNKFLPPPLPNPGYAPGGL